MSPGERLVEVVTANSRVVIAAMLVLTVLVGAGAPSVEQSSSLDQFQSDTEAAEKLEYVETNFTSGDEDTTTAQIIVRGENVLSRESLLDVLVYQQALRENGSVADTLSGDDPILGVANVVATAAIRQEEAADLQARAAEVRALNRSVRERQTALERDRTALQERQSDLNETADLLRGALTRLRGDPNASVETAFEGVRAESPVALDEGQFGTFSQAARQLRVAGNESAAEAAYRLGTRGVLADEYGALQEDGAELERRAADLRADAERLQELAADLQADREALADATSPSLAEQRSKLESMNESQVEAVVATVLDDGQDGDGGAAFGFMPTDYEPGSTSAEATMLLVTQRSEGVSFEGVAPASLVDSQLAMRELGRALDSGLEFLVFGSGLISEEIENSMTDSLVVVGPLAMLFVLLALAVAYRDLLDIVVGTLGIGVVLVWTFGFMGWTDVAFNQIFVAIPVLLIGLSIDYAIHIFMRHREHRAPDDDRDSRDSMRVALAGVGVALVLVTATTVIGFLSNLISPVPPIREFGLVSAAGIVAALLVFGLLVPAVKVELDDLLESRGFDRRKRAFGTGGGRFGRALSVGSTAARRAPFVVVLVALVITAAGAYGATEVDTSFSQEEFLAEEPPDWMADLPEPFAPGEYTAKANLEYVNERFVREDSRAQLLVEGDVAADDALERLEDAHDEVADSPVTQTLSNGRADVTTPLTAMRAVAASNESFNATFLAADTDGDGVPDREVAGVYDALFAAAPDRARNVVHRTDDGEYRAVRLVVGVEGGADSGDVTDEMQAIADSLDGDGFEATATGRIVLFEIVQAQLLETVVQSLIITLVAVFAFLMVVYRLRDGSATLGAVTLLPVVLSVSWILGTMYLLDIPFNVLTGMITSLTVGLGVAYSIHLSERYNLELGRLDSVWDALDRSVTGTGGALLGSAATTVGGFGVLVFAVLPPLQQFGLITGLTIVYAFLASVVVLPSLLVLWTRYLGPEWTRAEFETPAAPGSDGRPAVRRTTAPATGPDAFADAEFVPATVTDAPDDRPVALRTTARHHLSPGESVAVTVSVDGGPGRVVLRESFDGEVDGVTDAAPDPVDVVVRPGGLYVAWTGVDGGAEVTYTATVSGDAADGESVGFDGTLMTAAGDRPVDGGDAVEVVADLFERVLAEGTVTDADLATAGERLEAGSLDEQQFERIYRAWLRGADRDAPELEPGADD